MGAYARKKAAELGERIYKGEIHPRPYRNKKGTACDYCPFADVCGGSLRKNQRGGRIDELHKRAGTGHIFKG